MPMLCFLESACDLSLFGSFSIFHLGCRLVQPVQLHCKAVAKLKLFARSACLDVNGAMSLHQDYFVNESRPSFTI